MSAVAPAWRGSDVSVGDVLEQLRLLRAGISGPRSSVLDMIIIGSSSGEAEAAAAAVARLSAHHPCRALIVVDEAGRASRRMDATIIERGDPGPDGTNQVHEEVVLRVGGPAADHVSSLVQSFLHPEVATFVWWTGSPPLRGAGFASTLEVADVLLLDSARFAHPYDDFAALAELAGAWESTVFGDFHWLRLAPWREVLAQFFNPADRRGFLRGISAVGVDYIAEGRGNLSAAVLLAGWLGSALGWRLKSAAAGKEGSLSARFTAPDRSVVELSLHPVGMAGFADGEITGLRIDAGAQGQYCRVHSLRDRADNVHVIVEGELRGRAFPRLVLPVPARTDEAVLSSLLIAARSDRAYPRALQLGAEILRSATS